MSHFFGKWLAQPFPGEEVVITGISGRFPESNNVEELQEKLFNKQDLLTSNDRQWKIDNKEISLRSGNIYNIDKLDAGFFGLHHRQAEMLNPITRKFLETAVEAIMDAGVNLSELKGTKTMVCVAVSYLDMEIEILSKITQSQLFGITGYLKTMIAHRLSYFLKIKGASYVVETACGSSMNALERAFQSIRLGKCENAIVGGGNLLFHPEVTRGFFRSGALSSNGSCKVFDEEADGYVRSESVACVFLQKAKNARRIYAQIKYIKINCDGYKDLGINYPSAEMQKTLISETYEDSEVDPSEVSYVEAHGTGTKVGDPEEVEAIDFAIAQKRTKPLLIGSLKSNLGHTEATSGLCSLIKVIIAMEKGYISPNIGLTKIKDGLSGFKEGRIVPVTELTKLEGDEAVVAINNFGIGGSNAHLLLKKFKKVKTDQVLSNVLRLICVSGRTEEATSLLLSDATGTALDVEYVALLHHIFKENIEGHCYRGFAIVSKKGTLKTNLRFSVQKKKVLEVVCGRFQNGYKILEQSLMDLPIFQTTLKEINTLVNQKINFCGSVLENNIFGPFAAQIGIIVILKLLGLDLNIVYVDSIGELISRYFQRNITLQESLEAIYKIAQTKNLGKLSDAQCKIQSKLSTNVNVLNMSDTILENSDILFFKENKLSFLELLGRLYIEGYKLHLHKLYPPIVYPVNRGTPMIAPSIKWDYQKSWYTYKYNEFPKVVTIQQKYNISVHLYDDYKYLSGHIVDGLNLMPAAKYLQLVWKTLVNGCGRTETENLPIVFENCKFLKEVVLPKCGVLNLLVVIQKISGSFKVIAEDSDVVSGKIFFVEDVEEHQIDLPLKEISTDRTEVLDEEEIYEEFYYRGHHYGDLFKGVVRCNIDASVALVTWENNWCTFINKMLQLKTLQDERLVHVPVGIRKLSINTMKHVEFTKNKTLCPIYFYKRCNIIKSEGIEICGFQTRTKKREEPSEILVLTKYVFVPNILQTNLEKSIRVIVHIIVENSLENVFKAVEVLDDNTDSETLMPLIHEILNDVVLVIPDLTVSSNNDLKITNEIKVKQNVLNSINNILLIVATKISQRPKLLNQILKSLSSNGFFLTREELDFVPKIIPNVEVISEYFTHNEKLVLFRKIKPLSKTNVVKVASNDFEWLPKLQQYMKEESDIVIYSQNSETDGILGLFNCLRREPESHKVRCFFIMSDAPKFDIENPFYENQMKKNVSVNIYKNGVWGTYRYLPLKREKQVENFVNDSMKWRAPIRKNSLSASSYYASLRRIKEEDKSRHSYELSDRDEKYFPQSIPRFREHQVMGLTNKAILTSTVANYIKNLWEVPDEWTPEEVSSSVEAYAVTFYGLLKERQIKSRTSILIHSGTSDIGLAALNVCLYYGCDIYLTVKTNEEHSYLKLHYPQIPENRISSLETCLETMVKAGTEGRGVDVVLNSLADEKMEASMRCLAAGGKFLQVGNSHLKNDTPLNLLLLEKNISCIGVVFEKIVQSYENMVWLLQKIYEGLRLGYIKPLPTAIFPDKNAVSGKTMFRRSQMFSCSSEKCHIIVGGLGGIGLELANWLHSKGARKLVLVSRHGIQKGHQQLRINSLTQRGAAVKICTNDVTTKQGCLDLMHAANRLGPVESIFNLAVVLEDALFKNQNEETFKASLAPKAQATAYLDEVTRRCCPELKYFVVFSSMTSGFGCVGQSNYGMANSISERICEIRKRDGFSGLAIQWGAVDDVGLAVKMQKNSKKVVVGGTSQQRLSSIFKVLELFLAQENSIVSSTIVANKINGITDSRSVTDAVANILGKVVNQHTSFADLGLDSMTSIEISRLLENEFQVKLTSEEIRKMTFAKLKQQELNKKN